MIRPATETDLPAILALVHELAAYEREPDAVTGTEDTYREVLFPSDGAPRAWAHVAQLDGTPQDGAPEDGAPENGAPEDGAPEHGPRGDGPVVGVAVWFLTFSTWTGRNGLWLEDLFVTPEHRGKGLGRDLMAALAAVCVERGYPRMEWTVLDWNTPAIELYRHLGAEPMTDWTSQRLTGAALRALGGAR